MSKNSCHPRFIKSNPYFYSIAKFLEKNSGIFIEPVGNIWIQPSTFVLQLLWQVPVIKSDGWSNVVFKQFINNTTFEKKLSINNLKIGILMQYKRGKGTIFKIFLIGHFFLMELLKKALK